MKYSLGLMILISLMLTGCAKKPPPEQRVFCIPLSQWNKLSLADQQAAVTWVNQNAILIPENLTYRQALGDAQFGQPWAPPPKGISITRCYRNMYYAGQNAQYYPLPAND